MTPYDGFGMYFEDPATYQEMGMDAPEPEDGTCDWCGTYPCADDCRPSVTGRSSARSRERLENGDPES